MGVACGGGGACSSKLTKTMESVRWGLIGCGDVAEHKGGPALYTAEGSSLEAVMSRDAGRAADFAERHGARRSYTSVGALLADPDVDAVYIATPPSSHAALTLEAAAAGKHILCEKPMALSVAEGRAMIEACRAHGVRLSIAYYRRYWPVIRRMKALVEEGRLGRLVQAHVRTADRHRPRPDGRRAWLTQPETAGGGFLTDVGTHRLDLLAYFLGEPVRVHALTATLTLEAAVDDSAALALQFAEGALATAAFNWNVGAAIDEVELSGTEGRLWARNLAAGHLEWTRGAETETFSLPAPAITHLGLVQAFVDALRRGEPNPLPGEDGLQATRMTEAAYQSAAEGRAVAPA